MGEKQVGVFSLLGLMREHLLRQQVDLITGQGEDKPPREEAEDE
ncbi:hypothetical protein [Oscillibacter sp.]|nr:hypothetical protein [Oscillibacter sp.]